MHIIVVGLNHRSAPIELRERLAFPRERLPEALTKLRQEVGLHEAAILSTCNRVEIYAGVPELDPSTPPHPAHWVRGRSGFSPRNPERKRGTDMPVGLHGTMARLHRFLSDHGQVELPGLVERLYSFTEPQSVHHLFSVASGIDSMVLGESEILHQVKHAYEWAKDSGATGKVFNVLFQRALNAAKAVRTQTAIGRGCTSIGTVSVELAEKIFGDLAGAIVLLIGAGKIGEMTLKRLSVRGAREIRIMNRSQERATHLASAYHAVPLGLEQLNAQLSEVDIVISSTSAPSFLLRRSDLAAAMHARHQRPLCLVDLGVPRNVEPSVGQLENVYLFDVDDLQGLVRHSYKEREQALSHSRAIIDQKVGRFLSWWDTECRVASGECRVEKLECEDVLLSNSSLVTRHSSLP